MKDPLRLCISLKFKTLLIYLVLSGYFAACFASEKIQMPFDQTRNILYSREDLWAGYDSNPTKNKSLDWRIYEYFNGIAKYSPSLEELKAQRSHDSGMDHAINNFFEINNLGIPKTKKIIVIMGSHSMLRSDATYHDVARLSYDLASSGYYIVTGGGPGLMEASHLGAYMSYYKKKDLEDALSILDSSSSPLIGDPTKQYELLDYWSVALKVIAKYPDGADSLGIPTWFYGHEGANIFSKHVAKYFSNALREEKICALGFYGAIFADGGPGTLQEIFMDAAQNGYGSYNIYSPMIFFSKNKTAFEIQDFIDRSTTKAYQRLKMTYVSSDSTEVGKFLIQHPPKSK
ncbi:MAG: hypothetical protein ABL927_08175 [Bdellovibrionales bacterium]